ncbi:MAG: DUF2225 domain-containing protein [Treponema sp.]|jgi:uncharacterized protein (DUF2225 family)|nr:DUF2225 domain-containing protein [Treponema sp.]
MAVDEPKVSYFSKEKTTCPVCGARFNREELLSGSGRLIAGMITDELHRLYEPSIKYGDVYPLVYQATVCPECWYASMDKDFSQIPVDVREQILFEQDKRMDRIRLIFPDIDFHEGRNLVSGAASQYLTASCYNFFPVSASPTIKQGLASLRAGWLFDELHNKNPGEHYDWLALLFKKKAQFLYTEALKRETTGVEALSGLKVCGPDTDKNYAYEGVLYLTGLLNLKYGPTGDTAQRIAYLGDSKRTIAKIFGLGRASKNKPGPLLEHARNLYQRINKELNETDE